MWYSVYQLIYKGETDEKESFQMACYSHDASYTLSFPSRPSLYGLYHWEEFDDRWFDSIWQNRGLRAQSQ